MMTWYNGVNEGIVVLVEAFRFYTKSKKLIKHNEEDEVQADIKR